MINILDRYIGKTILNAIIMTLFILVSLSSIIKFLEQLSKTWQSNYTVLDAGYYTFLLIPKDIEIFSPIASLLGTLLGLGTLAQKQELIAMQTVGFTYLKIAISVMKTSIPLIFVTMAIGEFIAPQGEYIARSYRANKLSHNIIAYSNNKLWLRDNNDFIYIEHIKNNKEIEGISIFSLTKYWDLRSILYATKAIWIKNAKTWRLFKIHKSEFKDPRQINNSYYLNSEWRTNLTPNKLAIVSMHPYYTFSIKELYNFSNYLKQSGQESKHYRLKMWNKIFQPFSVATMMLMAISFIFGPLYNVSMGVRIVTGVITGFSFYILNHIFSMLSSIYFLPTVISAILPSLLFFIITTFILMNRS